MNCVFREIEEDHLADILDIYNYYILNTTATFHSKPLTVDEMKELVFFENPKYKTFVILEGHEVNGYVILTQYKKREAYDNTGEVTIYLKHNHIGKGIGSKALKYIEDYAKKYDFHVLIAIICGENEGSISLFEKSDYLKCAHYKEVGNKFGEWLDVVAYQKIF